MRLCENDPRIRQLSALYERGDYSALVLTKAPTLSWLLGGRVQIGIAGDGAVCKAVVRDGAVTVLTNNIEALRLAEEEFGPVPRIVSTPWQDGAAACRAEAEAAGPNPLYEEACAAEVAALRTVLLPGQEAEAQQLADLCAAAVTETAGRVRPGMTEFEISGLLSQSAVSRGLIPNVLFTPADGHIARYRHALSGPYPLEKLVMLSMGAQKNGLYCSITRFVSFGTPDAATLDAQEKTCRVAAMLYSSTRPGTAYGPLYAAVEARYAEVGAAGQLALHHQGGLGSFQTRENRLNPDLPGQVQAHQLYAWNPSVTGFKSEDMLLVGETENRILTHTPDFPHKTFAYGGREWQMPQILIL